MVDLIPRAVAIEAFDDKRVDRNYGDVSPESVIKVIESIPAVNVMPVIHGHWIYLKGGRAECSECHYDFYDVYDVENSDNYCRHCGAKMN